MKILFFSAILICCSLLNLQAQDSVVVTFKVIVPEETPDADQIFWAGSLNHWDPGQNGSGFGAGDHSKPAISARGSWTVRLKASKNTNVSYKYTRGSFFSVEEKADYSYLPVRTIIFDRNKTVYDTIKTWHDIPPESIQNQWPKVTLRKSAPPNLSYEEKVYTYGSTILYDKETIKQIYKGQLNDTVKKIPDSLSDTVAYFHQVSKAQDNTILVLAGKEESDDPWNIYVDQNNDNSIDESEYIFTVVPDTLRLTWRGKVQVQTLYNSSVTSKEVEFTLNYSTTFPQGYSSSSKPNAPDLASGIPLKHRKGVLNGNDFYLHVPFSSLFSSYFMLTVDHNQNDTLEIGSGSNEVSEIDHGQIARKRRFYIHPSFKLANNFWTVANIDPGGESIRLRPAQNEDLNTRISKGEPAPAWEAITASGRAISSESIKGKYVLIDFWGSWCGPCLDEVPTLQKAYDKFMSKEFKLIGFAYDSESAFKQVMKNYDMPWPQVLDDKGNYSTKFLVKGYPTHYLIGPDGNVLETGDALRDKNLIPTLEKYFD